MSIRIRSALLALACASLACQTVMGPAASPRPSASATPIPTQVAAVTQATPAPRLTRTASASSTPGSAVTALPPFDTPTFTASGVRLCAYVPGVSVSAQMPVEVVNAPTPTPFPTATPPPVTQVDADITARQLRVFRDLWRTVNDVYVYPDFRGHDWRAIGDRYEALIQAGLTDDDFYAAMQAMIDELGDEHSQFQSPAMVAQEEADLAGQYDFVGIGAMVTNLLDVQQAVIISVFPDSPAAQAGLRPHDLILDVDGGPILDDAGNSRTLGPEGTTVSLTVQRPGMPPVDLTLTRRHITGQLPIDYCLVPDTRIGYIFFPTFFDETIPDQVRQALEAMTADGPLAGLILDNRQNGGGVADVADAIMGLFASGLQGYFVSRDRREPLRLKPEDVGGSQSVPLVVLVDVDTASYGEIASGVLRVSGRAQIVGQTTYGNVERLWGYDFEDGSRAYIASETFEPRGQTNGLWEDTGIIPDVLAPTRWDLFTEATDPALAAAVDLLLKKNQ